MKNRHVITFSLVATLLTAFTHTQAASSPDSVQPLAHSPKVSTNSTAPRHTNRLAKEKSPYLLQHQHNPVDWYPWGEEAFAKARAEKKPIFLSIGYSTCHWCHVMERETFEDETVAKYLNEHFVSIKVDREERPDVDQIYMSAVQTMTGQGGWPLNLFLTPDLKPFYGGTYFPPQPRYGRPSFLQLLEHINGTWQTRHDDVQASAAQLHEHLSNQSTQEPVAGLALSPSIITNALKQFKDEYDPRYGGFGDAPKFPRPAQPALLLNAGIRLKDAEAVKMVLFTCDRMAAGGMNDQLGGGFARYSVDAKWLVPHFEKMLYDNAQLLNLYLDAYTISGEKRYADTARDIVRYVLRDMTHAQGGFYSAEDADSEGKEGKFYCWTKSELSKLLTAEEFSVAVRYFGVTEEGNFVDHSDPAPLPNQNVLSIVDPKLTDAEAQLLASAKTKLFNARSKRVRPHLDDKILSSWNGLMLGALARAYAILGDESVHAAAEKNLHFLQTQLWDAKSKTLYHRWRDGARDDVQLLDAYAFLLAGVIDLYEATLDPKHLEFALTLADSMIARFYDPEHGGFYESAKNSELILRVKEDYDGAEPSGNSVATLALLKLAAICDRSDLKEKAERTLKLFAQRLQTFPRGVPYMLQALDFWLDEPRRAVIAGDSKSTEARTLLHAVHAAYQPHKVVLGNTGPVEAFAKTLPVKEGPTVYLCTGTACQPPTKDPEKLKKLMN